MKFEMLEGWRGEPGALQHVLHAKFRTQSVLAFDLALDARKIRLYAKKKR